METSIVAKPGLKTLVTRICVPCVLGLVFFVQPAWSAISISPTSSTNGSYTVSWGSPLGCSTYYDDFGAQWDICYWLTESGPQNNTYWTGNSRNFSGKPSGTYTYNVLAHFVSYMWGVDTYQTAEGPASISVCTTHTVPRYTGWVNGSYSSYPYGSCTFYSDGPIQYPSQYQNPPGDWCGAISPLSQNGTMQICN